MLPAAETNGNGHAATSNADVNGVKSGAERTSDVEAQPLEVEDAATPRREVSERRMTSAFPQFELSLEHLDHFVAIKAKGLCKTSQKQILFDVSSRFVSGELCALMGPSGAGKSSLLNTLIDGRNPALRLNGEPLPKKFHDMVCVIPQADILFPALTPRQSLYYSAKLRLPERTPDKEIEAIVDGLLQDLNLVKCKDTPVGDETRRGVSGGERKRVSIGMELVVNPAILLVDEPSSGLDSTAAEGVVELLQKLTRDNGQMVICTIHQPSYKLFTSFDKLLLLHHGRVVYNGQGKEKLHAYFTELGHKSPEFENPLDFYMRELQKRDAEDNQYFARHWAETSDSDRDALDVSKRIKSAHGVSDAQMAAMTGKNSFSHEYRTLLTRYVIDTVRDKEKFLQGLLMKLAIGVLLGVVFINQARSDLNASIFTSTSPLFFLVISAVFDTAFASILTIPLTRPLLVREYRNGAFSVSALFFAQITSNLIFDTLSSLAYAPAYPIVGLGPTAYQFFTFLAATTLITGFGSALGLVLGSTSKDVKEAQSKMIPVVMPLLLFCGFLIPYNEIPDYFIWLFYLSPFQWTLSALLINEFEPRTFTDGPFSTGVQYLESQNIDPNDLGRDFGVLIALDVFVLLVGYLIIRRAIVKQAHET